MLGLKQWAYVALAAALIAAGWAAYAKIYDAGFNAAMLKAQNAAIQKQNEAIQKAREQWEATAEAAQAQIVTEEKIVEKIKVVEREIPKIVEKIVTVTPECNDLGADFLGVYNDAISASNHRETSGTGPAPESDLPMP